MTDPRDWEDTEIGGLDADFTGREPVRCLRCDVVAGVVTAALVALAIFAGVSIVAALARIGG